MALNTSGVHTFRFFLSSNSLSTLCASDETESCAHQRRILCAVQQYSNNMFIGSMMILAYCCSRVVIDLLEIKKPMCQFIVCKVINEDATGGSGEGAESEWSC